DPPAVERAHEEIAPERVGAEEVPRRQARPDRRVAPVGERVRVWREPRPDDHEHGHRGDDRPGAHRRAVFPERPPRVDPEAPPRVVMLDRPRRRDVRVHKYFTFGSRHAYARSTRKLNAMISVP